MQPTRREFLHGLRLEHAARLRGERARLPRSFGLRRWPWTGRPRARRRATDRRQ